MIFKKLFITALAGTLLASLGAYAQETTTPSNPNTGVFATINGETVPQTDFYTRLENYPITSQYGSVPAGTKAAEEMFNEILIMQYAKKNNVAATDAQVQSKIDMIAKQAGGNIDIILMQSGMTLPQLKQKIAIQQSLINVITKDVVITDADVKKGYDEALKAPKSPYKTPDEADLSIIMCSDLAKIKKAYQQLQKGADFGKTAAQYSEAASAKTNKGSLGWVTDGSPAIPADIFKAAWNLEAGKYTVTIKASDKKWYIAKVNEKRSGKKTPFDEVKESLKEQLAMDKASGNPNVFNDFQTFIKESSIAADGKYQGIADRIKEQAAAGLEKKPEDAGNSN